MKYLAAYMLATLGGNANPSADDVTTILSSVGIEPDASLVDKVCSELNGKDVQEVIEAGKEKFSKAGTMAVGAAPVAVAAVGAEAAGAAAGGAAPAAEAPAEEEEEEDEDMGFSLFD